MYALNTQPLTTYYFHLPRNFRPTLKLFVNFLAHTHKHAREYVAV